MLCVGFVLNSVHHSHQKLRIVADLVVVYVRATMQHIQFMIAPSHETPRQMNNSIQKESNSVRKVSNSVRKVRQFCTKSNQFCTKTE